MSSFVVEAIYEGGVLRPNAPLPLRNSMKVLVTVQVADERPPITSEEAERIVRRSQGMVRWRGDLETLRQIAEGPEFDWLER